MTTNTQVSTLSIGQLKRVFREARPIDGPTMSGFYTGLPAGPWWFRLNSKPTLGMTGFGGWLGKQFLGEGKAVNMFQTSTGKEQRFPMTLTRQPSQIDGKDTLVLLYPTDARAPWCWVTDELRQTADGNILGMTFVNAPLIRHMVFPFVLLTSRN